MKPLRLVRPWSSWGRKKRADEEEKMRISRLHSSFCIQKTDAIRWKWDVSEEAKKKREQIILILRMKLVGSSSKVGAARRRRRRRLKGFASMLMDRNLSFCQLESAVVMSISTRFSALSARTVRWRSTKTKERPSKSSRLVRMLLLSFPFLSSPLSSSSSSSHALLSSWFFSFVVAVCCGRPRRHPA